MKKYVIALYIRLSLEDFKTDSLSISSQRMILQEHAAGLEEYGNAELMEFVDNGYSGANFERPAVQELLDLVRANRIDCIMVKDFSKIWAQQSRDRLLYRTGIPDLSYPFYFCE